MKACPICKGEGKVKDDLDVKFENYQNYKNLLKLGAKALVTVAILPATLLTVVFTAKLGLWLIGAPALLYVRDIPEPHDALSLAVALGAIGGIVLSIIVGVYLFDKEQ